MLILVVGPSGAGKDTLLNAARARLAGDPAYRFVRRVITRPPDPDGENHEPVTQEAFAARRFALQWAAHGLSYGIPLDIEDDLALGVSVIANTSRAVIADAVARYDARVILITAPAAVLATRLAQRARETHADIAARLARDVTLPTCIDSETILNDTTPDEGADRFLAALRRMRETA